MPETMQAVIFNGPYQIDIEERPNPIIIDPTDAIVKVSLAGVCGSELHMYRGHQKTATGHIMGHEFTGTIESIGPDHGYTNRCTEGTAFGTQGLAGGQAEYVRVPFADGTLHVVPPNIEEELLIMMCDIFPTGYYGASRAITPFLQPGSILGIADDMPLRQTQNPDEFAQPPSLSEAVFVCIGCGPVGLCAIATARSKGVRILYVVDSVEDRLEEAAKLGGIPLKLGRDDVQAIVLEATGGRGADAVIEVVGNKAALRSAFDMLRPCGVLSSIGFHQGDLPFTALECYQKNLNINIGRAPVGTVFDEALEVLIALKDKMKSSITHRLPLSEAAHAYDIFEKQQARKVILRP